MRVFKPPRGIVLKSANCSSFLAEAKINGNFHKFSEKLDIIFDRRRGLSSIPCHVTGPLKTHLQEGVVKQSLDI